MALLYESWWATRRSRVWVVAPGDPSKEPELLFDRSYEDIYSDPGSPLYVKHPVLGTSVLARVDGERKLLMLGALRCCYIHSIRSMCGRGRAVAHRHMNTVFTHAHR